MEIEKALKILKLHNEWRRDGNVPSKVNMQSPADIGAAIDTVIELQSELLRQNREMREAIKTALSYFESCREHWEEGESIVYHDLYNACNEQGK